MTRFVLTPAAERDVIDLVNYIGRESPSAAVRLRDALRDAMRLIGERPAIGHMRADLADEAIRFWPVFSYLVIYRPETNPVQIIRVLHGKRDVRRLLEE